MKDDEALRMAGWRDESPLGEDDFAEIRRNVLGEIERRERRGWFAPFRIAFAAAAVAVCAIVWLALLRPAASPGPAPLPAAPRPVASGPPAALAPAQPAGPAPAPTMADAAPAVPVYAPRLGGTAHASRAGRDQHRAERHRRPAAILAGAAPIATMEIQTSNPDIRIIWIAR